MTANPHPHPDPNPHPHKNRQPEFDPRIGAQKIVLTLTLTPTLTVIYREVQYSRHGSLGTVPLRVARLTKLVCWHQAEQEGVG